MVMFISGKGTVSMQINNRFQQEVKITLSLFRGVAGQFEVVRPGSGCDQEVGVNLIKRVDYCLLID